MLQWLGLLGFAGFAGFAISHGDFSHEDCQAYFKHFDLSKFERLTLAIKRQAQVIRWMAQAFSILAKDDFEGCEI